MTELHPAYRLSGVARPVDPAYPTNKAVLILVPLVLVLAAGWTLFDEGDWIAAGLAGLNAGLLVFLCWALTRELTPDDNPAAFLAVAIALATWARVGHQSILIPAATLMAARMVNRSTGLPARLGDSILATIGFGLLAWFSSWTVGVVGAVALILDAILPAHQEPRRRHLGFAAALVIVVVARILVGVAAPTLPAHLPVFATIAGLGALAALLYPSPISRGDVDERPLVRGRVRAGLGVGVLAAVLVSIDGGLALVRVAGLWSCVLATALGLPFAVLKIKRRTRPRS